MTEPWLDRAIEDKLGEIINNYRSKGQPVHNVGALRQRVAADINALRGTSAWVAMQQRYEPRPMNRLAWCCVCDKPVTSGAVTAWLEDKSGNIFCSQECRDNTDRHPISLDEYKRRMKERGSMTTTRKEIIGGEVVDGEQITITWDQVRDWGGPYKEPVVATSVADEDTGIDWSE